MVRYLVVSDAYKTEGLTYTSSQFHWTGDGTGKTLNVPGRECNRNGLNFCPCTSWRWDPKERFIDDIVDAYEKAYPNLKLHNNGFCQKPNIHGAPGSRLVMTLSVVFPLTSLKDETIRRHIGSIFPRPKTGAVP